MRQLFLMVKQQLRDCISCMLVLGMCIMCAAASAQNVSNEGRDFYAVFPTHVPSGNQFAEYHIFITSKQASSGSIFAGGQFLTSFTVTANSVTDIAVPRPNVYINGSEAGQVLSSRSIHVVVDPGNPKVVVYGHIFAGRRSAASLILPKEAMGQQYFSMNYTNRPNNGGDNFIVVAATEPNTRVFIRRNGTDLVPGGILLSKAGDVYEYLSTSDLTGTEIIADPVTSNCKRFAVFSGNTNVVIGTPNCLMSDPQGSDPLYQQNYPVENWGTTYGFIPFSNRSRTNALVRTAGSYYRVLAKDNGTEVSVNGAIVATLNSGEFYQPAFPSASPAMITASKPVAVAQYALTMDCQGGGVGDPDMVILNPIEYNIKKITVYSSTKEAITDQYINVFIKTAGAKSFRINGTVPAANFTAVPGAGGYSYLRLNLNSYSTNNFSLSADSGFNAIAYGFGDKESYAYSAGTSLASTQFISAVKTDRKEEITNACTKEDFLFKLILPELATGLTWFFDVNDPGTVQNNLQPNPVIRNGKTFYEYYYPRPQVFQTAGQRSIKVLVEYPTANTCYTSEEEVELLFDVYDPPQAAFTAPSDVCINSPVAFTDQSTTLVDKLIKWSWDFGDGTFSSDQNPVHAYTAAGNYTVMLSVGNGTSCSSTIYTQDVKVLSPPEANFSVPAATCADNSLVFTSTSTTGAGTLVKWLWNFGDSTKLESTTGEPVTHTFAGIGEYTVSLSVVNSNGCSSMLYRQKVNVFAPFLEAGPDRAVLRGGQTILRVTAKGNNIKYKWSPATGLDYDNVKEPVASPSQDITYTVTITTAEGCVLTDTLRVRLIEKLVIPNTFTPNNDGINDVWNIQYLDTFQDSFISIYNRYGEQIFSSAGYPVPWDGRARGESLPVGTYYYLIRPGLGLKPIAGPITIIR